MAKGFEVGAGVLAVLFGAVPPASAAHEVFDAGTGLTLVLPRTMSAHRMERPSQDVTFSIRSAGPVPRMTPGSVNLCQVGYRGAPQNASLSQAQINAVTMDKERQDSVRATMGRALRVHALETFELRGARGLEVVGTPLTGPGSEGVRVVMSLLETPLGRLTMSCATLVADLEAGLPVFRDLREGVRLPDEARKG